MKTRSLRAATLAVLTACLLAGCSTDTTHGLCPGAAILASTSSLTVLRKGAQGDPAGEIYTAVMTDVKTDCDFDKDARTTSSNLAIGFRATRPPSGAAAQYSVPYFVVATQAGGHILNKRTFIAQFSFAPGSGSAVFSDTVAQTLIDLEHGKRPADYEILVGFQLTQDQLDYNKKMGQYAP